MIGNYQALENRGEKNIDLVSIPVVIKPEEIRAAIRETTTRCSEQIAEALREKRVPQSQRINLQYALRSGYLMYEEASNILTTELNNEWYYNVTHSVIGVSGTKIYAPPEVQNYASSTLTVVMDTSAGSPDTLITVGKWYENQGLSYYVTALSTNDKARSSIAKRQVNYLEGTGINISSNLVEDIKNEFPGRKLRMFYSGPNQSEEVCLIGDLGDIMFRKNYENLDEIFDDINRIKLLTLQQRMDYIQYFMNKIQDKVHNS
jgi:hypothetical protein